MAYDIIHKNSTVAGTPPAASEIEVGEIAINAADAELYTKDTDNAVATFISRFTQAGSGANARTLHSKLSEHVSIFDFIPETYHASIKSGTSSYDATADLQNGINAAVALGLPLFIGGKGVKINTSSSITIPQTTFGASLTDDLGPGAFIKIYGNGATIRNTQSTIFTGTGLGGRLELLGISFVGGTGGTAAINNNTGVSLSLLYGGALFRQCNFTNFDTGLLVDTSNQVVVDQCIFITNKSYGCRLDKITGASSNVSEVKNCIFYGKTTTTDPYDLSETLLYIGRSLNCRIIRNTFEWPQRYGIKGSRLDATVIESNYFEHGGVPGVSNTYDITLESSPLYTYTNTRICQNLHSGGGGGGQGLVSGAHHPISIRSDYTSYIFGNIITGYASANVDRRYEDGSTSFESIKFLLKAINIQPVDAPVYGPEGLELDKAKLNLNRKTVFSNTFALSPSATEDVFTITSKSTSTRMAVVITICAARASSGSNLQIGKIYGFIDADVSGNLSLAASLGSSTEYGSETVTFSASASGDTMTFAAINSVAQFVYCNFTVELNPVTGPSGTNAEISLA